MGDFLTYCYMAIRWLFDLLFVGIVVNRRDDDPASNAAR